MTTVFLEVRIGSALSSLAGLESSASKQTKSNQFRDPNVLSGESEENCEELTFIPVQLVLQDLYSLSERQHMIPLRFLPLLPLLTSLHKFLHIKKTTT